MVVSILPLLLAGLIVAPGLVLVVRSVGARVGVGTCWTVREGALAVSLVFVALGGVVATFAILACVRGRWRWNVLALLLGLALVPQWQDLEVELRPVEVWTRAVLQRYGHEILMAAREDGRFATGIEQSRRALERSVEALGGEGSPFWCGGRQLPYDVEVLRDAHGPVLHVGDVPPGTVLHAASADGQRCWATLVVLAPAVGRDRTLLTNEYGQVHVEELAFEDGRPVDVRARAAAD